MELLVALAFMALAGIIGYATYRTVSLRKDVDKMSEIAVTHDYFITKLLEKVDIDEEDTKVQE